MSGCCLEGLDSRNCLAGLRNACAPMGVSALVLEAVSYDTLVLQTWTYEFLIAPQWATFNLFFSPCGGEQGAPKKSRASEFRRLRRRTRRRN